MVDSTESNERSPEATGLALASGDPANAERMLLSAIQTIEGVDGRQLELASALINLGKLKQEMGVSEEAEPLLARALAISESQLGEDHPDLLILLNDLTRLYLKRSAYASAEPLLLRLLAMKRSKGEDHPEVATVLASLAAVRQALGRHEAAEQLWRRVLDIRERSLAPNHFALATTFEHLAETCAARGKLGEALQLFRRAQTIRERTLGADHSSLRVSRERIADLQLQASEDSLDPDVTDAFTAGPDRLLLRSADRADIAGSAPALETIHLMREAGSARVIERAPSTVLTADEEIALPARNDAGMSSAAQPRADVFAYGDVLLSMRDELEKPEERETIGVRVGTIFASVGAHLRNRSAASIAGAVAMMFLLVALAAASNARDGLDQTTVSEALPSRESLPVTAASFPQVSTGRMLTTSAPLKAYPVAVSTSTPRQSTPSLRITEERSSRAKTSEKKVEPPRIAIPTVPAGMMGRVDSVARAVSAPVQALPESFPAPLAANSTIVQRPNWRAEVANSLTPARVIGALPSPRYPSQLLYARVGGEVRVRFNVDTAGRPVMSTFSVVGSPNALLVAEVLKVIPAIRFEPARNGGAESTPVVSTVQIGFQFAAK
jgi:TonB family protein